MEKYYLTCAIDYVNAEPHIGHAYEKIAADILARFHRMMGHDVYFLVGVDEHGSKVQKTAEKAGKSPQAFTDEMSEKFRQAWKKLLISSDDFIRTTEERHKKVVQEIFRRMQENGDIYKGKYAGLYCEGCEDYLRERDLVDGNCPNHKRPPAVYEEENYFFALTKYKERLRKWLNDSQPVRPDGRRKEVLNQLDDEEFGDFSVSRHKDSLQWGIPVPGDPDQVIYVWVDALTNYITGVGCFSDEAKFKRYWPADLHLIGKDIVKFHSIYWPAMLMSAGIEVPKLVFGHGFITVEGQKMSKTLGNVIDPMYLADTYGADPVRYFLFAANSFDQDGDFSRKEFIKVVNGHLANNFGNLLNRTLTLLQNNCDGKVPPGSPDAACLKHAQQAQEEYIGYMEKLEFAKAIEAAIGIVDEANKYLADKAPWKMFKQGETTEGAAVLLTALELFKRATVLLNPIIPQVSAQAWRQLGFDTDLASVKLSDTVMSNTIPAGQSIRNEGPVFRRLEEEAKV